MLTSRPPPRQFIQSAVAQVRQDRATRVLATGRVLTLERTRPHTNMLISLLNVTVYADESEPKHTQYVPLCNLAGCYDDRKQLSKETCTLALSTTVKYT